jgi:hypothetical protein
MVLESSPPDYSMFSKKSFTVQAPSQDIKFTVGRSRFMLQWTFLISKDGLNLNKLG